MIIKIYVILFYNGNKIKSNSSQLCQHEIEVHSDAHTESEFDMNIKKHVNY